MLSLELILHPLPLENRDQRFKPKVCKSFPSDKDYAKDSYIAGRCQTLSPATRVCTETELKRYSCTRGLRSIPYLIISNISMTSGSAVLLSTTLTMHRPPERLLAYLPGGKALTLPDSARCSKGIVWLPNETLGSPARELLKMTEKLGRAGSDIESEGNLYDDTDPLRFPGPSHGAVDVQQRQMRKKLDLEYTRLTKRVRIDVLNSEGVHSAEIWSAALKMMVWCRAILLDDRDRHLGEGLQVGGRAMDHEHQMMNPDAHESEIGPFHPGTENFDTHFPSLRNKTGSSSTSTSPLRKKDTTNITTTLPFHPKLPSSGSAKGLNHVASNSTPHLQSRKQNWRFDLPMDVWCQIIALSVGAEGILDRAQQRQIMSYATNWDSLAQEMSVQGAPDYQQIWKILESVGCFTYNPVS
jgi:hypothetical protein